MVAKAGFRGGVKKAFQRVVFNVGFERFEQFKKKIVERAKSLKELREGEHV